MNTISHNVLLRLTAQANEADLYGDTKVADNLTKQIEKYAGDNTRSDDEDYEYTREQMVEDVVATLWDAVTRIFDYYEATPDAKEMQEIIDQQAEDFIGAIENFIPKDIGPHEPETMGHEKEVMEHDEVDEDTAFKVPDEDEEEYIEDKDDEDEDEDEDTE